MLEYFISNKNNGAGKEAVAKYLKCDDMDMAESYDFICRQLKIYVKTSCSWLRQLLKINVQYGVQVISELIDQIRYAYFRLCTESISRFGSS